MKTPYTLADGQVIQVETDAGVAEALAAYERDDRNERRNQRRRNEASIDQMNDETGWEPTDNTVSIETDYVAREETESVRAAIMRLSERQRRLVRLRHYEEKTESEISVILGISHQAVSQQLATIKTAVRKYFEKFYD